MLPARQNPFATDRLQRIRYRFVRGSEDELWKKLRKLHFRSAIVGPEGHGKTTLLEDLATPLSEAGFQVVNLRLSREQPRFARGLLSKLCRELTDQHCLLFDGAEQLGRLRWWSFVRRTRRAGGLIITSHRPGLLPTLIDCSTTPELLQSIVADLLPGHAISFASISELFAKHHGDLREALRDLYDLFAAGDHSRICTDCDSRGTNLRWSGAQPVQGSRHE